jgi:HEAT repeat protein
MRKTFGMNRRQKAVYRQGERRAGREQIAELLEKARSEDPEQRCEAAENLCPCHVRRRIEPVWEALYRMLEDPDVRVRRAAWHTLEDGGTPGDPALDAIIERALKNETDRRVRNLMHQVTRSRRDREMHLIKALGQPKPKPRGKCDFCGESNVFVEHDLDTMIPTGDLPRAALICEACAKNSPVK